jgi:hypothetical protein
VSVLLCDFINLKMEAEKFKQDSTIKLTVVVLWRR